MDGGNLLVIYGPAESRTRRAGSASHDNAKPVGVWYMILFGASLFIT